MPAEKVNLNDLIDMVAEDLRYRVPKQVIDVVVASFLKQIGLSLHVGLPVLITKFGRFRTTNRAAVIRHNPRTGAPTAVPPKRGIIFQASPQLKERVNARYWRDSGRDRVL